MKAIGDGPYNSEPRSSDKNYTRAGTLLSELPHQVNGKTLNRDTFNVHQTLYTAELNWEDSSAASSGPELLRYTRPQSSQQPWVGQGHLKNPLPLRSPLGDSSQISSLLKL
ncbi:hypothetical protein TNCV_2423011 [Trichonephila clavipes]|nr:hypothetical protein TNCV_2423011 [Trichonephila clavipes]